MKKKGFTLMEILVVVVIIGVLATLGIPAYQKTIEDSRARVCGENLKALSFALNAYAMDHDTMPGNLSSIPMKYIEKAYAAILKEKGAWKIKLAHFILDTPRVRLAYADSSPGATVTVTNTQTFLKNELAKGNLKLITCHNDSNPPAQGGSGISYGLNNSVITANMTSQAYRALAANTIVIADCDNATFTNTSGLRQGHRRPGVLGTTNYALRVDKGGNISEF